MIFKRFIFICALGFVFSGFAQAEEINGTKIFKDLKDLTLRCVVEPYIVNARGEKMTGPLKSICKEIQESRHGGVDVSIRGTVLHAVLVDSENSDGGDLNHLLVVDSRGNVVAEQKEILAFDNIFIALAGGDTNFRQVNESN